MRIKKSIDRCKKIALLEHSKNPDNLEKKLIKLSEEVGEFSAAYLMSVGSKGTSKTPEQVKDNVLEEGCDVTLVILSILIRSGFTLEQIDAKLQEKMNKWESQVSKK